MDKTTHVLVGGCVLLDVFCKEFWDIFPPSNAYCILLIKPRSIRSVASKMCFSAHTLLDWLCPIIAGVLRKPTMTVGWTRCSDRIGQSPLIHLEIIWQH